jgi:hypothetical protein
VYIKHGLLIILGCYFEGILVDELQLDPTVKQIIDKRDEQIDKESPNNTAATSTNQKNGPKYPANYETCVSLLLLLWNMVRDGTFCSIFS